MWRNLIEPFSPNLNNYFQFSKGHFCWLYHPVGKHSTQLCLYLDLGGTANTNGGHLQFAKKLERNDMSKMLEAHLSFVRQLLCPFCSPNEFADSKSFAPGEDNIKHGTEEAQWNSISCGLPYLHQAGLQPKLSWRSGLRRSLVLFYRLVCFASGIAL